MKQYTIEELKDRNLIIFEAIMGSHAYGTSLPSSDTDIRGVWIQPVEDIFKYGFVEQIADEKNDIVYYELRRFMTLAMNNNPNVLEILFAPKDVRQVETSYWNILQHHCYEFLTKRCRHTFAGYAIDQIKKAKGYNKKINWEEANMTRKTVLDFCYILEDGGAITLQHWLANLNRPRIDVKGQNEFGLAKVDHAHDIYAMYDLSPFDIPKGIVKDIIKANDVQLCSFPKEAEFVAWLTFNKDAWSTHCKRYNEYQTWLKERNPDRFKMNKEHGKNYDSKNMMHTFRLLKVALEIANDNRLRVRRPDDEIEILMKIRKGEYEYDNLVSEAEAMIQELDEAYDKCKLPQKVNQDFLLKVQAAIYEEFNNDRK